MGNKTQRNDVRAGGLGLTHDYFYDAVYRLVHTVVTDPTPAVVRDTEYVFDGVGNRLEVIGSPDPGTYTLADVLCEPGDKQVNQYTSTPFDAREYDENGNLVHIDPGLPTQRSIAYDYRNQMVEHADAATGILSTYAYDALGRRIRKVVDVLGVSGGPTETRFLLDGWQEIEERDGTGAMAATYTFGLYIDEVLTMRRPSCLGAPVPACLDFFYHTDDLYNVMAVSDAAGAPAERYEYADYGQPLDPSSLSPSVPSWEPPPLYRPPV
jgi:YD repeat-containing protein